MGNKSISRLSRKYSREQNPEPGIVFSSKKALKGATLKMLGDKKEIITFDGVGWP